MIRFRLFVGLASLTWVIGAGQANEPAPTPQPVASDRPNVVATSPGADEAIEPGEFTLSVTFDVPMRAQSFSFVRSDDGAFPECRGLPTLSSNALTYSWPCTAAPNQHYVVSFNRPPYMNFKSAETGQPATPFRLHFSTRPR